MIISKTIEIDMGHRVPNHKSKCRNLHGHRYKIEVGVDDKVIDEKGNSSEGMVIDYSDLKEVMMDCIDKNFDHGFVMYNEDQFAGQFEMFRDNHNQKIHLVGFIPTAENLSKFWYKIIQPVLKVKGIKLKYVVVWETPSSMARYEE